jgi:hypothetical protein
MQGKRLMAAYLFSTLTGAYPAGAAVDAPRSASETLPVHTLGSIANSRGESVPVYSASYKTFGECVARSALESVKYVTAGWKASGEEASKIEVTCRRQDRLNEAIASHAQELRAYLDESRAQGHAGSGDLKDVLTFFDNKAMFGLGITARCDPFAAPKATFRLLDAAQALVNAAEDQQVSVDFDRVLEVCTITAGRESADVLVSPANAVAGLKKPGKITLPLPGEVKFQGGSPSPLAHNRLSSVPNS